MFHVHGGFQLEVVESLHNFAPLALCMRDGSDSGAVPLAGAAASVAATMQAPDRHILATSDVGCSVELEEVREMCSCGLGNLAVALLMFGATETMSRSVI